MTILTAAIAKVQIGILEIDGLLLEDGSFGVALPQLQELNLVPPNRSRKQLEALLGIVFQSHQKVKTPLNSKAVNSIGLGDVTATIVAAANNGVTEAIAMRDALVGLSLTQLFSDSFGIKFEKEERQQYLIERQTHRKEFHSIYTPWLKQDGLVKDWEYGCEVNRLKKIAKLPLISVDDYDYEQISKLNLIESNYNTLRKAGLNHSKALEVLGK